MHLFILCYFFKTKTNHLNQLIEAMAIVQGFFLTRKNKTLIVYENKFCCFDHLNVFFHQEFIVFFFVEDHRDEL